MRFAGRVWRDSGYWLAEVPVFEALSQGHSRAEALEMIEDWFLSMVNRPDFSIEVQARDESSFELGASELGPMISLLLQRQRQKSGLSLAQVAERLGARSRNAYARYERGDSVPTIAKLDELLRAVSEDRDLLVGECSER